MDWEPRKNVLIAFYGYARSFFFHEAVLLMDIFEVSDSQTSGRFEKGETLQETSLRLNGLFGAACSN